MALEKFAYDGVIPQPRAAVWTGLLDPDVLERCVDGCDYIMRDSGDRFRYQGATKIGPFSRQYRGTVTMADIVPGESLRFFRGSNRPFVGPGAFGGKLRLEDHPEGTQIHVEAEVEMSKAIQTIIGLLSPRRKDSPIKSFVERFSREISGS